MMERRRLAGLVALIVLVLLIGGLTWYQANKARQETPVAFEPARSTDESTPASGPPIEPPASLTAKEPAAPAAAPTQNQMPPAAAAAPPATMPGQPPPAAGDTATTPSSTEQPQTAANPPPEQAQSPADQSPAPPPAESTTAANNPAPSQPPATEPGPAPAAPPPAAETAAAPAPAPVQQPQMATSPPTEPAQPQAGPPPAPTEQPAMASNPPTAVVPPAAAPEAAPAPPPTFDVVRVSPTGETVVAGLAEPNATVEILDGAGAIATAQANDRGEWAMALDKALPPGTHDLSVRTTSQNRSVVALSDQRVAVEVPAAGSKDVLVVLNSPDAASKVMQGPQAQPPEKPAAGTDVASAEPQAPKQPEPPLSAEPQIAAEPPVKGEPPVAAEPPATQGPQVAIAPATPELPPAPSTPPPPPKPEPAVALTAVEADTAGELFVAGTTATPGSVRVYFEGQLLGEAKPAPDGTWLLQVHREVPAGTYRIRADQVAGDGGDVVARAEVPFEREINVASLKATGTATGTGGAGVSGTMPQVETVIIKRGDNLWRLAREAWGRGIRWTNIYQANRDQIRNPRRIYPGQVFMMPKVDASAKN